MLLSGPNGDYRVERPLASTTSYRLYLSQETRSKQWFLLQVASSAERSGELDRAAFLLKRFKAIADVYDVEYAKTHESGHLHYDRLYPAIVDSFLSPEQGMRRINILSLTDVDNLLRVVPLSSLRTKDRLRIDPETSAWIMGRLLKLLTFVHGEGVANRALTARNILLDHEQHFAITLDWSTARVFPDRVPKEYVGADIAKAATAVFSALGGSIANRSWPYEGHEPYIDLLKQLMLGRATSTKRVLVQFYELVRNEYGQHFHPFTTLPL